MAVWLAILPAAACAADPGAPPGIPTAPQSSELAQARAQREARDRAVGAVGADSSRTTAWQKAVDQADGPHFDELTAPRTLAAIVGTAWFLLAVRAQWRSRRRVTES